MKFLIAVATLTSSLASLAILIAISTKLEVAKEDIAGAIPDWLKGLVGYKG